METVKVIFRKFPTRDGGDVLALFPGILATPQGHCLSYQHVGQHGAADYSGCIAMTRPAMPAEYADLARELVSLGYELNIRRRR